MSPKWHLTQETYTQQNPSSSPVYYLNGYFTILNLFSPSRVEFFQNWWLIVILHPFYVPKSSSG